MVRPEKATIKRRRATGKRHPGQLLNLRSGRTKIKAGYMPALAILLRAPQHEQMLIDKYMPTDFCSNCNLAENLFAGIKLA